VRLLDTATGAQLWAETYDEALEAEALFAVQDAIREQVVGTLAGSYGVLSQVGLEEAQARGTDNLTAYDCVLSAYDYERVFTPERHAEVRDCLERAVELDPDYADAWAKLAFVTTDEFAWGFNPRPDSMARAMAAARKAVSLDPTSQTTRWHMARTHYWNGDREAFFLETEKALALNPNNSFVLAAAGAYYANAGNTERGAALAKKAMAINPHHPTWYHFPTYQDLFDQGLYEEALEEGHRINLPGYYWTHATIAAAAGMAGDLSAGKEGVIGLQETYPGFTLETARQELAKGVDRPEGDDWDARFIEGLRLAGVPETPPAPSRPVIAVLPFDNMSGDPEQEYFADGITEDIISALSLFSDLAVIARTSPCQFNEEKVDVREIGRKLGADYILEGSVRRSGDEIRITAQLVRADDGFHLWTQTYDRDLSVGNVFQIQDEITSRVVGRLADTQGVVARAIELPAHGHRATSLGSYECLLLAYTYQREASEAMHLRARDCLEAAVAEHPEFAAGWAWLGFLSIEEVWSGWNARPDKDPPMALARQFAEQALRIDPSEQKARQVLALTLFFTDEIDEFIEQAERTIELNPYNAELVAQTALYLFWATVAQHGDTSHALEILERSRTLNPYHPNFLFIPYFWHHYFQEDYDTAVSYAEKIDLPGVHYGYLAQAAVYGQLGLTEKAQDAIAKLLEVYPNYPENVRGDFDFWHVPEDRTALAIEGLRKAGLDIPDKPVLSE
jgi:TolB-like protein